MLGKGGRGREPERNNQGPARPPQTASGRVGPPPGAPVRPRPAGTGPAPARSAPPGRYAPRTVSTATRRANSPREQQRDRLRLQARDFARQFQIPEDVAFQIVRGDFTFKDWMERHQSAVEKRQKREVYEHARKVERACNEGMARQYFLKQKKNRETMVFVRADGTSLEGPVTGILPYYFYVGEGKEQQQYEKLSMLYCYKKEHERDLEPVLDRKDGQVAALGLEPSRDKTVRYQVPELQLKSSCETHRKVTFTMQDGRVFTGTVDWYSKYNVKLRLERDASVVLFSHAVHAFQPAPR